VHALRDVDVVHRSVGDSVLGEESHDRARRIRGPGIAAVTATIFRHRLPTQIVSLLEGGTPLSDAPQLSERTGARVLLKLAGLKTDPDRSRTGP